MVWGTTHELAQPSGERGGDHVGDHGGDHAGEHVGDHIGDHCGDRVGDNVGDHVGDNGGDHGGDHASEHGVGGGESPLVMSIINMLCFSRGDYVDFVMIVIKFLRQQTRDLSICWQVDCFFLIKQLE